MGKFPLRCCPMPNLILSYLLLLFCIFQAEGNNLQCQNLRKDITPCTCKKQESARYDNYRVFCEGMGSFEQIADSLRDSFSPEETVDLRITYSQMNDLSLRSFQELGITVTNLKLNYDEISELSMSTFEGLGRTQFLSLADNVLSAVPSFIFQNMPLLKTVDLGRGRLQEITQDDFKYAPQLQHVVVVNNLISRMDRHSLPPKLLHFHVGRNALTTLNGTLRNLQELEWLFINANQLTTLDNEMPSNGNKLILVHAANNRLTHLPQSFKGSQHLESLFFQHNLITGFNGALQRCRKLKRLQFSHNNIRELFDDDFFETENLEDLQLGYNELTSLNGSLLPLKLLRTLNLTHNLLKDFSVQELRGLRRLRVVDLSHNRVERITGRMENLVESETRIVELRLDHNRLTSLDGALMGVQGLVRLSVAHNLIERISPGDLIGLDVLRVLDVSHNRLTALEETAKTFLPALDELFASHNRIRALHQDFHGLPSLCWADLSHNEIEILSPELVRHTRCSIHGAPLKIYLQDNPVLCDDRWPETMTAIEGQQARVYGSTQCVGMALVNNANSPLSLGGPDIVDSIIAEDGTIIGGQNVGMTSVIDTHKSSVSIIGQKALTIESIDNQKLKGDTFGSSVLTGNNENQKMSVNLAANEGQKVNDGSSKISIGGSILAGAGLSLNDNRVQNHSGLDNGVHKIHTDFSDVQKITNDQTITVLSLNSGGQAINEKTPIVIAPPILLQPPAVENLAVDNPSSDEI